MLEKVDTMYLDKTKSYLVALSGGADSVALLRSLLQLGYAVEACHCNFHLRGSESDRDQRFCEDLCKKLGVKLHTKDFDTRAYAKAHHVSIEMAARDQRYEYFHELINSLPHHGGRAGVRGCCVAHHLDDQVETVLLNLVRGTGIEGLKGMMPVSGEVVRPLLGVSRKEILDYLDSIGQDYVTDSTNLEDDAQRNILRHKVIPELLGINPNATENIAHSAKYVGEALTLLQTAVDEAKKRVATALKPGTWTLDLPALRQETAPETILWYLLKDKGFTSTQVEQIYANLNAQSGKQWQSCTHRLLLDRGKIIIENLESLESLESLETIRLNAGESYKLSKDQWIADVDADKVKEPLTLRHARQGDWFIPFGMKGRKLLSDFLTDRKLSLFDKQRQLVVEDAEGKIIWLPGQRIDNRVAVTGSTKEVLRLSLTSNLSPLTSNL